MTRPWDMVSSAGALVMLGFLLETAVPWLRSVLRKRRKAREAAERKRTQLPCGCATAAVASAARPSTVAAFRAPAARRPEITEADRLWAEARGMAHNFIPDPKADADYLTKVFGAAKLGHLEAMVKLGAYARRRGVIVEAFYWTWLADLKGAKKLARTLFGMRAQWMAEGCPKQYGNAYEAFTDEQGALARAVLRLQCGVDPQHARARLKELAERGVEEARLFLKRAN